MSSFGTCFFPLAYSVYQDSGVSYSLVARGKISSFQVAEEYVICASTIDFFSLPLSLGTGLFLGTVTSAAVKASLKLGGLMTRSAQVCTFHALPAAREALQCQGQPRLRT